MSNQSISERKEGQTAEEELKEAITQITGTDGTPKWTNLAERIVDIIKELIDERATEKAEEAIGTHTDDFDHDLLYAIP